MNELMSVENNNYFTLNNQEYTYLYVFNNNTKVTNTFTLRYRAGAFYGLKYGIFGLAIILNLIV